MGELETLISELTSEDDARAARALSQIPQHGEPALDFLLNLYDSDEPDRRWWAVVALSSMDYPRANTALIEALGDGDPTVRQCAAAGLRQQPIPDAVPRLIEALGDEDRLMARLASGALAAAGPEAIHPLSQSMQSEIPQVRIEAARALGQSGDPDAIPALFAALNDTSAVVIHLAEVGLERLGVGMVFFRP
jgi:HEAT repeat protein